MPKPESVCRVCGWVFVGVKQGRKAPEHDKPYRKNDRCIGSGQGTTISVPGKN
ncbi:hypothetical protein GCM10010417_04350 [Streptomyces carpaticus]